MGEVVAVDSVAYNLAGDVSNRMKHLQSIIIGNVISNSRESIADQIKQYALQGPAMELRSFYRWARREGNYDQIGIPDQTITITDTLDQQSVADAIPHESNETIALDYANAGSGDPVQWATQYLMDNQPSLVDEEWLVDVDTETNTMTITHEEDVYSFNPDDFSYNDIYVYARYRIVYANNTVSNVKLFIYKVGSGNQDLDDQFSTGAYGQFFPFIPVRIDNSFLTETYNPTVVNQITEAYKRATGGDLNDLVDSLKDNDDLDEIDHAYVVFGVSLNTPDNSCKKYLYKFFSHLMNSQIYGLSEWNHYLTSNEDEINMANAWFEWMEGGQVGPQPPVPFISPLATKQINIAGTGTLNSRYNIEITWDVISEGWGSGIVKPGTKAGDLWFENINDRISYISNIGQSSSSLTRVPHRTVRLYWQRTDSLYTYLDISNLNHKNTIYKSHSVKISAQEALDDPEESGFIIPLHYDIWRQMSLIDAHQMTGACYYLVLNCYKARKKRWYEKGIFRIVLVIVVAIVSVLFTAGAGIGLLGSHLAVGSALGFAGMSAAIVGAVVNALAAMLLMTIIEKFAVSLFGEWGTLVAAILSIVITGVASSFHTTGSLSINWGSLLKADNLLKFTDAVGTTVANMIRAETTELYQEMYDYAKKAAEEVTKIQQAFYDEFGYGNIGINPLLLTDSSDSVFFESSDTFLTRTLMTGSEIAEMSHDMLSNFPEYTLTLSDAFS